MKCFIVILLSLLPLGYATPPITRTNRITPWRQFIIGGTEVQDFSEFAYQLSLRMTWVHICGASIIADQWALTAAHCFEALWADASWYSFRAGSRDRTEGGVEVNAEQFFIHPLYSPRVFDFDVAVVRTIEPFTGEDVRPIPLIDMGRYIQPGTVGTISGWGLVNDGSLPLFLQKLDLEIWDHQACFMRWFEEITTNMFCAGGEVGYDSCDGDSGGPLVVDGVQVGIVSSGAATCGINWPGVYCNITHPSIRSFILHRTGV